MDLILHDFRETVHKRVARDPAFREAMLKEGIYCIRSGEVAVGMSVLQDYIAGTGAGDVIDSISNEDVWRSLVCDMPEEAHAIVIGAVKRWLADDRLARPEDKDKSGGRRRTRRRVKRKAGSIRRRPLVKQSAIPTASGD